MTAADATAAEANRWVVGVRPHGGATWPRRRRGVFPAPCVPGAAVAVADAASCQPPAAGVAMASGRVSSGRAPTLAPTTSSVAAGSRAAAILAKSRNR